MTTKLTKAQRATLIAEFIVAATKNVENISSYRGISFSVKDGLEAHNQPPVKNWLTEVRGPLQWLINNGYLKRTADLHNEEYVLLKAFV